MAGAEQKVYFTNSQSVNCCTVRAAVEPQVDALIIYCLPRMKQILLRSSLSYLKGIKINQSLLAASNDSAPDITAGSLPPSAFLIPSSVAFCLPFDFDLEFFGMYSPSSAAFVIAPGHSGAEWLLPGRCGPVCVLAFFILDFRLEDLVATPSVALASFFSGI